jgi:hypothetical protein
MAFVNQSLSVYQIRPQHRNEEVRELIPADFGGVMKKHVAEQIRQRLQSINAEVPRTIARIGGPHVPPILPPPPNIRFLVPPMDQEEVDRCTADVREGRVYTIENISRMLRCHKETVR